MTNTNSTQKNKIGPVTKHEGSAWYKEQGLVSMLTYVPIGVRQKINVIAASQGKTTQTFMQELVESVADQYDVEVKVKKKDKTETHVQIR